MIHTYRNTIKLEFKHFEHLVSILSPRLEDKIAYILSHLIIVTNISISHYYDNILTKCNWIAISNKIKIKIYKKTISPWKDFRGTKSKLDVITSTYFKSITIFLLHISPSTIDTIDRDKDVNSSSPNEHVHITSKVDRYYTGGLSIPGRGSWLYRGLIIIRGRVAGVRIR